MAERALTDLAQAVADRDQPALLDALARLEQGDGFAAAVRACDPRRTTPNALHLAASRGYPTIATTLLSSVARCDAALDVRDASTGNTAFTAACAAGNADIVAILIKHGCRTDVETHEGQTGWDLAQAGAHLGTLANLREQARGGHRGLQAEYHQRLERKRQPAPDRCPPSSVDLTRQTSGEERRRRDTALVALSDELSEQAATEAELAIVRNKLDQLEQVPPVLTLREAVPPLVNRKPRRHSGSSPLRRKCDHPGCPDAWRLWPTVAALERHKQIAHGVVEGAKTIPLSLSFLVKTIICPDRLGTNTRKTEK
jgi:hypothetical protein